MVDLSIAQVPNNRNQELIGENTGVCHDGEVDGESVRQEYV